jgi:hypothetical protein
VHPLINAQFSLQVTERNGNTGGYGTELNQIISDLAKVTDSMANQKP